MSSHLPDDIFRYIYTLTPYDIRNKFILYNHLGNNLYNSEINMIKKIQRFYRNYKIPDDYLTNAGLEKYRSFVPSSQFDSNDWDANIIIRFYISKYPFEYLYRYPEFMANKLNTTRKEELNTWINNNLPNIENRNLSDIDIFFRNNNITPNEFFIAGW